MMEITRRGLLKGLLGATILVAIRPLASLASHEITFKLHNIEINYDIRYGCFLLRGMAIPDDKRIRACFFACAIDNKSDEVLDLAIRNAKKMIRVHLKEKVRKMYL